jgi:hypothetical protein
MNLEDAGQGQPREVQQQQQQQVQQQEDRDDLKKRLEAQRRRDAGESPRGPQEGGPQQG